MCEPGASSFLLWYHKKKQKKITIPGLRSALMEEFVGNFCFYSNGAFAGTRTAVASTQAGVKLQGFN